MHNKARLWVALGIVQEANLEGQSEFSIGEAKAATSLSNTVLGAWLTYMTRADLEKPRVHNSSKEGFTWLARLQVHPGIGGFIPKAPASKGINVLCLPRPEL